MTEKQLASITQMQKLNALLLKSGTGGVKRQKQLELQAKLLSL